MKSLIDRVLLAQVKRQQRRAMRAESEIDFLRTELREMEQAIGYLEGSIRLLRRTIGLAMASNEELQRSGEMAAAALRSAKGEQ